MATLFDAATPRPLADRLRPGRIGEIVGQDHLFGPDGPVTRMVQAKRLACGLAYTPRVRWQNKRVWRVRKVS